VEKQENQGQLSRYTCTVTGPRPSLAGCLSEIKTVTPGLSESRKTNNQASFGGSLFKNNMEVEAAMELQRHLDEHGVHRVYTVYVGGFCCLHHVRLKFAFYKKVY
jgi:hypothetical protein